MKYYSHKYKQLDLGLFRSSLSELDKSNRWVVLCDTLPWPELEKEYNSRLQNDKKGAGNKPARMIIDAMMIKHRLNLSDVETIEMIRENPYMQYMCGLSEFTDKPIFDPSLFVTIRKRITEEDINKMSVLMLKKQMQLQEEKRKRKEDDARKNGEEPPAPKPENPMASSQHGTKLDGNVLLRQNMMRFLRELCLVLNEIWRVFTSLLTKRGVCDYPRHLAAR